MEISPEKKFVFCGDSLSSLQSLSVLYSTDALSMQVQLLIDRLLMKKYQLVFCWVPGHVGICSNEFTDQAAKDGTWNPKCDISLVPSANIQGFIKHTIFKLWQSIWDSSQHKLRRVKISSEIGNHHYILFEEKKIYLPAYILVTAK